MSITLAKPDDILEFEDGEQMYRDEFEKLPASSNYADASMARCYPPGSPLYSSVQKQMEDRRVQVLKVIPALQRAWEAAPRVAREGGS